MATRTVAGVTRADAGFGETSAFTAGNSFSSDLIQQIEIDLGASDAVFDGDGLPTNEAPNDPTQTYDDGFGAGAIAYDFTVEVIGSNGVTYEMVIFDYDINNDGDFGGGNIGDEDAGENNYFMAFRGPNFPPPGITLTTTATFTDTGTSLPIEQVFRCFEAGTEIETPNGPVSVEDLEIGSLVLTQDNGAKPIRWIGSSKLDAIDLMVAPKFRPIVIRAGALGEGYPAQDLTVSPQHRMLVRSVIAQRMFGQNEVLIPAIKLVGLKGIEVRESNPKGVEYFHILFDEHQIIFANGAPTESLFAGPQALKSLSPEARAEIEALFPEIAKPDFNPVSARYIPNKGRYMRKLAQRHQANNKPLYA